MNAQEIFDTVVSGLIKQGRPSVDTTNGVKCLYRGPNGTKCAVGLIIPDDEYTDQFEKFSVTYVSYRIGLQAHCTLLELLQEAHDDSSYNRDPHGKLIPVSNEVWMERFMAGAKQICAHYNLEWKYQF